MKTRHLEKCLLLTVSAILSSLGLSAPAWGLDIGPMKWTVKSDWINVKNCTALTGAPNAKGNGTTDDTPAIQAAINYLLAHSDHGPYSTLYFPAGTYKITSTLNIPHCYNLNFIGCGSSTIISWAGASGLAMIHPDGTDSMRYVGFVWKGNNIAGCAYAHDSASGYYETDIRHENESFHDFTVPGTYVPGYTVPAGAITSGFYDGNEGLTGETMIYNCAFNNCTTAIYEGYQTYNNFMWHVDSCEFENCGNGVWYYNAGDMTISNSHFQNSTNVDVEGGRNLHVKHCTSTGSNIFYLTGGGAFANSIQDCYVDSWKNYQGAVWFGRYEQESIFDCTFTNPPPGAQNPIYVAEEMISVLMSNNWCPSFGNSTALINYLNARQVDFVPPGTRAGVLTSAATTFLKTAYPNETTHIIDVTAAPYNADRTGVNDCTNAIQSAINAAITANNNSEVYIPGGKYHLTSTLTANGSNFTISGAGFASQIQWWSGSNGTQLSMNNPKKVTVKNIQLAVLDNIPGQPNYVSTWPTCDPTTMTSFSVTATAACSIVFDDTYNTQFFVGNPPASNFNPHGNGILLSNLPVGSTVYMNHVTNSVTVNNCGAAEVFARFLQMGVITVEGTGPKTGFFGALVAEGGQGDQVNGYNFVVNDNQDMAISGYYSEQARNDLQMSRGGGTGTGRVTIDGFLSASGANGQQNPPPSITVDVENYAGRLLYLGQAMIDSGGPVNIQQNGTNAVDMILPNENFYGANQYPPNITTGTGANLVETMNEYNINYALNYLPDVPNPLSAQSYTSIAQGLDHLRQLEAVDLSMQFGMTADAAPIAVYPFEGTVNDMTGTYNGTNSGATYGTGVVGSAAAQFNGTSSYVVVPKSVTKNFSIAMWVKTTDTGAAGQWRLGRGLVDATTGTNKADFGTALNAGKFSLGIGNPDTTLTSTTAVNDGNWHHVVGTYNSTTGAMQVYVDGVLNNSGTGHAGTRSAGTNMRIGSIQTGIAGGFFNGLIDQVQIYNYVVSAADVSYIYARNVPYSPPAIVNGLVARWKLDETAGPISVDSSGQNVTGHWQNSPVPSASVAPVNYADPECLTFNGVNQFVSMSNIGVLPSGTQARTICGWAKPNSTSGGYSWIAAFGSPNGDQAMFIGMNGSTLVGGGYGDDLDVANFWDNNWHFIALTYDGTTANLYADGNLVASGAKSWNLVPGSCYIGEQVNNASEYFNGSIDDVRIYNRVLSATEIANLAAGNQ